MDAPKDPSIDIERFAALSAELESGVARDELCAREGVSADALGAAREAWLAKMADEVTQKRFELTNRYNKAFVARKRALSGGKSFGRKPSKPRPAPAPRPAGPPAVVAPPPASEIAAP